MIGVWELFSLEQLSEKCKPGKKPLQLQLQPSHGKVVVGLDDDVEMLVRRVVDNKCSRISIVGIGELGKTTLARRLYNHPMVRCHFEAFAWFTVGKQFDFDTRTFYTSLLKQLAPEETKKDIFKCYTTELIRRRIMEVQSSVRCLVVLDDVWLKEFFMCNSRDFSRGFGSKFLVTTQIQQVAERVRSDETYQMRHLNENESFELFVKRAFVSPCPDPELYGMKDIVKRCEGIPLIIDVLGRLLASKHTLYESKALLDATSFCLDISKQCGPEQLERELLSLSYNHLPDTLKLTSFIWALFLRILK